MTDTTDTASLLAKMLEQTKRFETVIIKDHEAQRLVAAFEAERRCRIAAEARVKELELDVVEGKAQGVELLRDSIPDIETSIEDTRDLNHYCTDFAANLRAGRRG